MTVSDLIAALDLPAPSRVDRRVPKSMLAEHATGSAAQRRMLQEAVDELTWVAALKPSVTGIPACHDGTREVPELAVLSLRLRVAAHVGNVVEIVHRAIPYPVVLAFSHPDAVGLSLASAMVEIDPDSPGPLVHDWLSALPLRAQPHSDLCALYQGWRGCVEALQAGRITGRLVIISDSAQREARRQALAGHLRLQRELTALRAQAKRERQLARRVELNLACQRLQAQLDAMAAAL